MKVRGYDPRQAKLHSVSRTGKATSRRSGRSVHGSPSATSSESTTRDKLQPLGRTDYLLKDKTASMASLRKRDGLRMETSYDLMSRELWRMAQHGENPFDATR